MAGPAPIRLNSVTASKQTYKIPFSKVPEAILKSLRFPGKAGISRLTWITSLIPLMAVPGLVAGLTARTFTDADLKSFKKANPIWQFLRNIYPPAYTLMMICGVLNGVAYASLARILSYLLLLAGSVYVWHNEAKRNAALEKLVQVHSTHSEEDDDTDEEYELKNKAAEATAAISAFSRIYYGFAMFFTFLANVTQTTRYKKKFPTNWSLFKPHDGDLTAGAKEKGLYGFGCYVPEAKTFNGFLKEFRENFIPNAKKEISAGLYYTKELLSPAKWVESMKLLTGNSDFEKAVDQRGGGNNQLKRLLLRVGESEFNCRLTMINGILRITSVIGTAVSVANLGGLQVFNNEDPLLRDDDIAEISEQKPLMKALYDAMMFLNNIGLFLMGICSISTGSNKQYELVSGTVSSLLQTLGGSLTIASAVCDQLGLYLIGQAMKLISNGAFQLANIFATCNKAVPNLVDQGMVKGLTLATAA